MPNLTSSRKKYKNSFVLRNDQRREARPLSGKAHKHHRAVNTSLRVVGVERLLEPVAGAWGHLVHACSQESKSNFQSRASITLSNCNI